MFPAGAKRILTACTCIIGRKRRSSEQDEEELVERKKSRPLRCKCNFTAEDVEDIACEYLIMATSIFMHYYNLFSLL